MKEDMRKFSGGVQVIDVDSCVECGTCQSKCNFDAVSYEDGHVVIDPKLCTGCGACVPSCPFHVLG